MKKKLILYTIIILTILISSYSLINYFFDRKSLDLFGIKEMFSVEQKEMVRKYLFPQRLIKIQEKRLIEANKIVPKLSEFELLFKNSLQNVQIKRLKDIELSNSNSMQRYNLVNGFYSGIYNEFPGSGYIDFSGDNLFILSARGVLSFIDINNINDGKHLKQIDNNIEDFLNLEQYKKTHTLSLKDLFISDNKIYISYTEEIKKDCWNTSVIHGSLNYDNVKFENLFRSDKCIIFSEVPAFEFHQSGGRMIQFDNNNILLTTGEYRDRSLAQDNNSYNGKTIKININTGDTKIISMGHRNQQGMYFDKENGFIVTTEHGPKGGDEINIIEVKKINDEKILNYGWPIASYGEHYKAKKDDEIYKKFPLHKSHSEYGFIEPIKFFVPSIGISEVTKIENNYYVLSSLRDKSLYFFRLDDKKLSNLERVTVSERIRDISFKNNKLYLFLEDTATLGIISLN